MPAMTAAEMEYREFLCDRVMLVQEASGIGKQRFAHSIGISAPILSDYANYRSSPSHAVLSAICSIYGVPQDFSFIAMPRLPGIVRWCGRLLALAQAKAKRASKAA